MLKTGQAHMGLLPNRAAEGCNPFVRTLESASQEIPASANRVGSMGYMAACGGPWAVTYRLPSPRSRRGFSDSRPPALKSPRAPTPPPDAAASVMPPTLHSPPADRPPGVARTGTTSDHRPYAATAEPS